MSRFTLEQFTDFLKEVNLKKYRDKYSKIKTVEMDLPRPIQALDTIYAQYWDNQDNLPTPPTFEEYYKIYYQTNRVAIEDFWHNSGFGLDCDCFKKGLEARIYRTWASLITQIHAGYVAEQVFGVGNVKMSTELDHQGVDILALYHGQEIRMQIKKDTQRREIARMRKASGNGILDIYYIVPQNYDDPRYTIVSKKGELRPWAKEFIRFNPDGTLDRLDNGFVIFTERTFRDIIA